MKRTHISLKKQIFFVLSAVLTFFLLSSTAFADENDWWNFRNSAENNAVTDRPTPTSDKEAWEKWCVRLGTGWEAAPTPPIIVDGKLYIGAGNRLYELNRSTGEVLRTSEEMPGNVGYAMNTPIYADGRIFIVIERARICAINISDMSLAWTSDNSNLIKGQTVSPISYVKIGDTGYVYTGTWTNSDGELICVSTNDDDVTEETVVKTADDGTEYTTVNRIKGLTWVFDPQKEDLENLTANNCVAKGFYWAGAYVNENYLAIGTDNGSTLGEESDDVPFYTLNPLTGEIIDACYGLKGPIRSTVVYSDGSLYFSTTQARIYKIPVTEQGMLGEPSWIDLQEFGASKATATPAVYKGRIYLGVMGTGGQFAADGGHAFCVVNDDAVLSQDSYLYNLSIPGYPQAGALLSNYNEDADFDGDGEADGRVYLYFTYNALPGGIFYTYDTPGQTAPTPLTVEEAKIFVPAKDRQQYCISPVIVDYDGTMYFKNDSGYIFAVEINPAALLTMSVTEDNGTEIRLDKEFQTKMAEYTGTVSGTAKYAAFDLTFAEGASATINGQAYTKGQQIPLGETVTHCEIVVTKQDKSRTYTVDLNRADSSAYLSALASTDGNAAPNISGAKVRELTPAFDKTIFDYRVDWIEVQSTNINKLMNLFLTKESEGATVKVWPGENCLTADNDKNIKSFNADGSIKSYNPSSTLVYKYRYPVYPIDPDRDVSVMIEVVSEDGSNTETYNVIFNRRVNVSSLDMDRSEASLQIGGSVDLTANYLPFNATDRTIKWTSSDTSVAKVETIGSGEGFSAARVTGLMEGTATITASAADNGLVAQCEVTVFAHMHETEWQFVKTEAKDATCEEDGNIEYWTCSVCGRHFTDESGSTGLSDTDIVIPARGHNLMKYEASEPTCDTNGNTEYWACAVCGRFFADEKAETEITDEERLVPSPGHDWGEWQRTAEPGCETEGEQMRICARDESHTETETISALGHDWGEWQITTEPGCETKGEQTRICARDETHIETETIPATGHVWGEGTIEPSQECEGASVIRYTCLNDPEHVRIEANGLEGHTWGEEKTVDFEPTCMAEGQKSLHCEVCGAIDPDSIEVLPALEHELVQTAAVEPSCTEDGNIEYYTCSQCRKLFADPSGTQELKLKDTVIKATGHDLVKTEAKAASCEEEGSMAYWTCSVCGRLYADPSGDTEISLEDIVIPAEGHTFGAWNYYDSETHKRVCTKDPSHTEYGAHSWNDGKITIAPTYTSTGKKVYTCNTCGGTKEETVPKLERVSIDSVTLKYDVVTYTGKARTQTGGIVVKAGGKTLTYKTDYKVTYSNNVNAGKATVTVSGVNGYKGSISKTFTIKPVKISAATLTTKKFIYNGKAKKPGVVVKAKVNGTVVTLTKGKDFTISYSNNTVPGKASAVIKGIGNFSGSKTRTFKIVPKGTDMKSLTAAKAAFTAKWYKQADQITGYQIQYSTNKSFKSGNKVKTISKASKVTKKITGLKRGKTYYVRVRTYKKSGGTVYYSSWSKKMKIKVK